MSDYTEWLNLASIIALLYFLMNVCWIINKKFSFPCHFFFSFTFSLVLLDKWSKSWNILFSPLMLNWSLAHLQWANVALFGSKESRASETAKFNQLQKVGPMKDHMIPVLNAKPTSHLCQWSSSDVFLRSISVYMVTPLKEALTPG